VKWANSRKSRRRRQPRNWAVWPRNERQKISVSQGENGCGASTRIQEITFEIGMLGKYGLDINDPQESHVLRALQGRVFSALQLVCITYFGFRRIEPGMDIGVDLGEEWGMARRCIDSENELSGPGLEKQFPSQSYSNLFLLALRNEI
jgi:hypothetical protein